MGTLEGMMNFWQTMEKYHRTEFFNGEMPYMTKQYTVAGDLVDWMAGIGIGFNTMGNYESATQYGASTPYLAPGCYEGGAGYAMMFMAQRVEKYEKGKIIYSTSVTDLIKDESGRVVASTPRAKTAQAIPCAARRSALLRRLCQEPRNAEEVQPRLRRLLLQLRLQHDRRGHPDGY